LSALHGGKAHLFAIPVVVGLPGRPDLWPGRHAYPQKNQSSSFVLDFEEIVGLNCIRFGRSGSRTDRRSLLRVNESAAEIGFARQFRLFSVKRLWKAKAVEPKIGFARQFRVSRPAGRLAKTSHCPSEYSAFIIA
jgi:hypothetical protein